MQAGLVPLARRDELGIELVQQGAVQREVGHQPDRGARHGKQAEQPGDQAAAQSAPGQPAAGLRVPPVAGPRPITSSGVRSAH